MDIAGAQGIFLPGVLVLNFINSSCTFACSYIPVWKFKPVRTCKRKHAENGKISREKTVENNIIYAIALRFQVIEI